MQRRVPWLIAQRLRPLGFTGGLSILKDYLHRVRAQTAAKRAYLRMEPKPGERFEIDWGHFGALLYQGHARKLYAFCLVECHSRKLFVEFTRRLKLQRAVHADGMNCSGQGLQATSPHLVPKISIVR